MQAQGQRVGLQLCLGCKENVWRRSKLHTYLAGAQRKVFACAQVEWHSAPAPVVYEQLQRHIGFHVGLRCHALFLPIAHAFRAIDRAGKVLAARHVFRRQRPDGLQQLYFLTANGLRLQRARRLHCYQGQNLQQVILHHVTQRARVLEIPTTPANADVLTDCALHVLDRLAVPQLFKDRIGKAEHQDVLHHLLPQIVVDSENLPLACALDQPTV